MAGSLWLCPCFRRFQSVIINSPIIPSLKIDRCSRNLPLPSPNILVDFSMELVPVQNSIEAPQSGCFHRPAILSL